MEKNRFLGYYELFDDGSVVFHKITARDRLTDERTDGRIIAISVALCIAVLHRSAIKISLLEAIGT